MIKKCQECEKDFKLQHYNEKYCCRSCFIKYRDRDLKNRYLLRKKQLNIEHKIKFKTRCIICNREFIGKDHKQEYCSKKCRKHYKKKFMKQYNKTYAKSEVTLQYRKSKRYKDQLKKYKETKEFIKMNKDSQYKYRHSKKGRSNYLRWSIRRTEAMNNVIQLWTPEEYQIKIAMTKGICIRCNKPYTKVKKHGESHDHIFSVIKAGEFYKKYKVKWVYTIDGIIPMGLICNTSKGYKMPKHIEKILQLNDHTPVEKAIKIIRAYEQKVNKEFIEKCLNM